MTAGGPGVTLAVTISLLATLLLIRDAAAISERSVPHTGAPISLRTALAGGVERATPELARGHLPPAALQAGASPPCWAGSSWGSTSRSASSSSPSDSPL